MYASILVPVDGSSHSRHALKVAVHLLDDEDGTLHLLNVQERPPARDTLGHLAGAPAADADEAVQQSGRAVLDELRDDLELASERVRFAVRAGRPSAIISAEAARLGVDAIVLGSRGAGDIGSLVMGSVSRRVLHEAQCRVIVVR